VENVRVEIIYFSKTYRLMRKTITIVKHVETLNLIQTLSIVFVVAFKFWTKLKHFERNNYSNLFVTRRYIYLKFNIFVTTIQTRNYL